MPGYDGTGPEGRGPMTGRGMGFCVLKESNGRSGQVNGFVGIQGIPIGDTNVDLSEQKIATKMPYLYGICSGSGFGKKFGCGRGFDRFGCR